MLSIRTNYASLNAQKNLFSTTNSLQGSFAKLSSGMRITKASDDAAGLGISTNLEAQIKSYNQAVRNAQDGISLAQVAEGAMNETSNILGRLRELAMQAASDGVGATERGYIQSEADALIEEVDRIAGATEYNGVKLLDGNATTLNFQVGIRDNTSGFDRISVSTTDTTAATLGVDALDLSTDADSALAALATIDSAIETISTARSDFGAVSNRFSSVLSTVQSASENISAANSRIRDVDVAEESAKLARNQVLQQAGVSVLAQANQASQVALKLLG